MGLIASERRKLTSVVTTWVLTGAGLLFGIAGAALFLFESEFSGEYLGTDAQLAATIDQVASASPLVLVVALLLVTTEFRHGTMGRTLQLNPSRTTMLLSKMAVSALYAVVFSVLGVALVLALALATGESMTWGEASFEALWQVPLGLVLTSVLGVAIGALLRSQVVAVALSLVWVLLVENLFFQFLPEVGRWLPFQALQAMFLSDEVMQGMPPGMPVPLDPLVGLSVFVGYVAVTSVAAVALLRFRDI
ncbi:MAG: ABC transporter permease [Nitriliruptoraceae bacterium]|nr:ABC transporter permease [Nitriliruptoraceae bacterium]